MNVEAEPAVVDPGSEPVRVPDGSLFSVPGLSGSAVACGLKESGADDLALIVADAPRAAAGVFTRNALPAAPVVECRRALLRRPEARSIVVNAGNANALTGEEGIAHAREMARRVELRCGGPALVLSTGVIGEPLPIDRVLAGVDDASRRLGPGAADRVARAILTTDTVPKTAAVRVRLPGESKELSVTVGGVAKGSGMIHPDMATMLAVVATDAVVAPDVLADLLRRSVERSFHEITVDGETSTNDTVLLLAGGRDEAPILRDDPRGPALERAVTDVMQDLASRIVHDGEGAERVLEIVVSGAHSDEEAGRVATSVARSALVKTALAGGDPNWGRILSAAANAGVPIDPARTSLRIGGIEVFREGSPVPGRRADAAVRMERPDVRVDLDLGGGPGRARRFTSDLTTEYVRINSEYTT